MKAGRELLQRVRAAFLEHGVAGLTMVQLARSAGVTRRTLYNYFSSRDDALRQVFRDFISNLSDAALARGRALEAEDACVLDIVAAMLDIRFGNIWRGTLPSPHVDELRGAVFHLCRDDMVRLAAEFLDEMTQVIARFVAAGRLKLKPGLSPARVAQMLTDAARGVNQVYPSTDLDTLYDQYRDTCQAILYGYAEDQPKDGQGT